ncbi:lipopolysaccharide kinase InaA family protein [Pseudomonas sp. MAP12]|uniref:Lipopolysaccharide kinase InaA family protein n=1 Tax=Geopseudomonas aromaticivorans TaxID=2849492 RepID=A0ABS6MZ76_9GAMM|nr:lipopolysaccharide kinase InaA family protein [Pseudomonas aromaticivorans]MBV2133577.1 lipopolysaccharide kinase InaA family protein [Pseudomonas aromaticivorans]
MSDFIAAEDRARLERHGLADYDALWALELPAVDEPNTERGGWSSVCRLELDGAAYYLKRQRNHLTRSLAHPLGEPTFARELRNIQRYRELGIPALQAAFYAERKVAGERRAILLTRALDGWTDLYGLGQRWDSLTAAQQQAIIVAVGELARRLHAAGQLHGCFYPKHVFLRAQGAGYAACLIDLEKTRPLRFGRRDRIKDLETLLRRADAWGEAEVRLFLRTYLGADAAVDDWWQRLALRRRDKAARR